MNLYSALSSATNEEVNSRKRVFAAYQLPFNNMNTKQVEEEVKEASSPSASRDNKRSRSDSPGADALKARIPEQSKPGLPLLPIIVDAQLPDPQETKVEPNEYLLQLVKAMYGVDVKAQNGLELGDKYFKPITDAQQAAYTMEVLTPARDNNVEALKKIVEEKGPEAVNCVNRFGESLLNLACRRGFIEVAEFLLSDEIGLDVRLKDDFGRTPMHDLCWHPKPQLEICSWLIKRDASLLLVTDKRGNTPFQYARAEDYSTWRQFLFDNRDSLQPLTNPATLKQFCA